LFTHLLATVFTRLFTHLFKKFITHQIKSKSKKNVATFFDLFNQHAEHIYLATIELRSLLTDFNDLERRTHSIIAIEKKGDAIMHAVMKKLHRNFSTPIDREQIYRLISTMDDMLDLVEDITDVIILYDIQVMTQEAKELANICVVCASRVKTAINLLSNMEHADELLNLVKELDHLEGEGDRMMRIAIAKLFREESDVKTIIKMKAIYELLETITDKSEDVANIIQGIVLENA
jgi:uncharacterized protein